MAVYHIGMKPEDSLPALLSTWRIEPRAEPGFRRDVWRKIRVREGDSLPIYLRRHAALAVGAAAVAVFTGGWAGHTQGQRQVERDRAVLAQIHLEQIDARLQSDARP